MNAVRRLGRRQATRSLIAVAVIAVGGAGITGCGSSDSTESTTAEKAATTTATAAATTVAPEELQETVDTALHTSDIEASSLPPLMQEALGLATGEPSPETMDKAFACWKQNSCEVGDGKLTIAYADQFGDNTWREFSKMSFILQAMQHPEVGKIVYTNAHAKLATWTSDVRSLVAQGVDGIVLYNDFGASAYPTLRTAVRAGVAVSTYVGPSEGADEDTITTRVESDDCVNGKAMAEVVKANATGTDVAYFAGTPGNPQDAATQKCATDPGGLNPVFKADTNWTPAGAQTATSALIASGKPVDAILYSYANPVTSIVKTFQKAKKDVPAIVTYTRSNGTSCQWAKDPYTLYQTNALNWGVRVSVTAVVNKLSGKTPPAKVVYPMPFIKESKDDCDASKPDDYPGTSALVPEPLAKRMLEG